MTQDDTLKIQKRAQPLVEEESSEMNSPSLDCIRKNAALVAHSLSESLTLPHIVVRELGHGAASVVYLTTLPHEDVSHYALALKISTNRLEDEAIIMQRVRELGASVPRIHASGNYDGSRAWLSYIAMDYISVEQLRLGNVDVHTALRVGMDIAETLDKVHKQSLEHCDIKPKNILLAADTVYLIDWGSAQRQDESGDCYPVTTDDISATLRYVAPERITEMDCVDSPIGAADQYSLASTLYAYLVGHTPYDQGDLKNSNDSRVVLRYIERTLMHEYQTLSATPHLQQQVPEQRLQALDAIIKTMLHPNPSKRYASCIDVANALKTV